jgi:hypothetical protein
MGVLFPSFPAYDAATLQDRLGLAYEENRRIAGRLEAMTIERDAFRDQKAQVQAFLLELGEMFDELAALSPACARLFEDMRTVRVLRAMVLEDCRSRKGRQ